MSFLRRKLENFETQGSNSPHVSVVPRHPATRDKRPDKALVLEIPPHNLTSDAILMAVEIPF